MAEQFKPVVGAENIPEAGATDITLPDVSVSATAPDNVQDHIADLRAAGLPWDDINAYVRSLKLTPQEMGYKSDHVLQTQLRTLADNPATDTEPGEVPTNIRQTYADALVTGETFGPDHFSGLYHGTDNPPIENLAAQLPNHADLTDQAQSVIANYDLPLTADLTQRTKANLVDIWAQTGIPTDQLHAQAQQDPLLADAITLPQPPYQPTMEELERDKRDAINPFYTPFDYQSIIGFAKDFLNLPSEQLAFREKIQAMRDAGDDPAKIAEAERDNPALNFFVPMIALGVGAKGLHAGATAVAPKLTELFHDETGSVPLGPKPDITGGPKEEEAKLPATETTKEINFEPPTPKNTPKNKPQDAGIKVVEGEKPVELTPEQKSEQARPKVQAQVDKIGTARKEATPELPPPPGAEGIKPYTTRLEDDLNRLRTNDIADKVVMLKLVDSLPDEWKDHAFLEKVSTEVERRLITPDAPVSPETQSFLRALKPLTDRQAELAATIKGKLGDKDAEEFNMGTPETGYVRRSVISNERGVNLLDPQAVQEDVITGGRPRTLSKYAPSTKGRTQYVFEDEETGARHFGTRPLEEIEHKIGDRITDNGNYTIKPATMEEVEASTKIRYNKDFLVNTVDNALSLERVNRNLDILAQHREEMMKQGLFVPEKPSEFQGPPGMQRVELPQMKGWANPKIANILNDFYQDSTTQGSLLGFLTRSNQFLTSTLFISPVTHIGNVVAHWTVGRGWDWIKPSGYGSLMRDGYNAVNEVWNLGPRYIEAKRNGSSLLYADTQTENFHQLMLNKLAHEMASDKETWGSYARSFGFKEVSDLVKVIYGQSRRALWMVGDMFMLQRQFELQRKGLSVRDAIFQAEKDIPNYRVPSEVMGSPEISQLLRSPNFMMFGRYKYGQIRALYLTVRDMLGPNRTGAERLEAAGKATILAALAMVVYPLMNAGLQKLTGNPDAEVKPFGPLSLINAVTGFTSGQKDWLSAVSSFFTLSPVLDLVDRIRTNKDVFGRPIIDGKSTPLGKSVQGLEAVAKVTYPGQLLMEALKNGPAKAAGDLVGLKLGTKPKRLAKWDKRDAAIARSRERKDPIESWIRSTMPPTSFGGTQQAAPAAPTGGPAAPSSTLPPTSFGGAKR